MDTAVITTVRGRAAHLEKQRAGLRLSRRRVGRHIVVAMGDPEIRHSVDAVGLPTVVLDCPPGDSTLPLAHARNLGAAGAIDDGAELLIFLDVDCIPGPDLVERYYQAAVQPEHAGALLCGPVTYLPPPGRDGYPLDRLQVMASPHPARPAPSGHRIVAGADYRLFWSLSFAVTAPTWRRIGGFCEEYRGYGGEDTDFAQCAAARGVDLKWIGGADAFHQHHPVSDPPVEHLDDILRNAVLFHQRWGWWPMEGWLHSFQALGLIGRDADGAPYRLSDRGLATTGPGTPS